MYKFYWSNLQKSQSSTGAQQVCSQQQQGGFDRSQNTRGEPSPIWTRQTPSAVDPVSCEMWYGPNPEPLPTRHGRPTTVRVTSPATASERGSEGTQRHIQKCENNKTNQHHTPTGSHRVLLKLRRMSAGAQQPRPKSVHGAEQVVVSDNNERFFNGPAEENPSILETLANLRTGEFPTKTSKKTGLPNSKSMHHFYSRTWTEKTLQRYQHNYENVYSEQSDNNNDNPVYENVYFRNGQVDNIVIGQMAHSPRTAAKLRHLKHQSSESGGRKFEMPPEPDRTAPPVPPERKGRGQHHPKNSTSGCHPKPLYRSKSCERPKMKDTVRDTFRINSDKFQMNISRISSNITDRLSTNVMQRFTGGTAGCGGGSISSSSRMSTGSTDVSSNASHFESPNSILQTVALKAIPCVDIQSHGSLSGGSEDGAHNLDYDNQEDEEYKGPSVNPALRPSSQTLASRMRDIRQDVQKRFSRLRSRSAERLAQRDIVAERNNEQSLSMSEAAPSEDSFDGEVTPVPARANWTPSYPCNMPRSYSGLPTQTVPTEVYTGPFVARARALVDCTPSPYDREALRFKRGDFIDIISMNPSGLWRGRCDSRVGHFKFITVELLPDRPSRERKKEMRQKSFSERGEDDQRSIDDILKMKTKPETVEDLLKLIGLEDHISVFVLNGYEELENFLDLDESELDYLGINDPRKRARIMAAVESLQDQCTASISDEGNATPPCGESNSFQRLSFPRDSGCYASNENLHRSSPAASDRSFHSGSQTESGIHLANDEEGDDDGEVDVVLHKRPPEQVLKTKAARDRHTGNGRDLVVVPIIGDVNFPSDREFAALVEKYSSNERAVLEGKFSSARSVFEQPTGATSYKNVHYK